jgi:hypothetical protein
MRWVPWSPRRAYPSRRKPVGPSTPAAAERLAHELVRRANVDRELVRRERWASALLAVLVCMTAFSAHLSTGQHVRRSVTPLCIQGPGMQLACAAPPVAVQRHGVLAAWLQHRLTAPGPFEAPQQSVARIAVLAPGSVMPWRELASPSSARWRCGVVGQTLSGAVLVQCGQRFRLGWSTFERY